MEAQLLDEPLDTSNLGHRVEFVANGTFADLKVGFVQLFGHKEILLAPLDVEVDERFKIFGSYNRALAHRNTFAKVNFPQGEQQWN